MRTTIAFILIVFLCASCDSRKDAPRVKSVRPPAALGSVDKPVQCDDPEGEREYLGRLYGPEGDPVRYEREGCAGAGPDGHILDSYQVEADSMRAVVYMDMYHPGHLETECVPGFSLASLQTGLPVTIPANETAQAEILRNEIQAVGVKDSCEALVARIRTLITAGINVNARDTDGNTALLVAACRLPKTYQVFKVLLEAGADVNANNKDGDSALHLMLRWGELDIDAIRLVMDSGISLTATNKAGDLAFRDVADALNFEEPASAAEADGKPDTHRVAAKMLLEAAAGKWPDYMAAPVTVIPAPPERMDPVVAALTDPARRDECFRRILSWQKYRAKPTGPERFFKPLRHVVVCPQKTGPPLHAVFPMTNYEKRAAPKGHVILIDADGAIIPYYCGANSLDDPGEFKDINGDGVIDEISTIGTGGNAFILHVLPMTRDQQPSLNILLRKKGFDETEWSWRLTVTKESGVFALELGPQDPKTRQVIVKAAYQWSRPTQTYSGQEGGNNLPFKRMPPDMTWPSPEYDAFVAGNPEPGSNNKTSGSGNPSE